MIDKKTITRFWNKVKKTDDCWEWIACTNGTGYGRFKRNGKMILAHRFSYELLKGKILKGLQIDHLCRNRVCVNPEHLEQVTSKENLIRGFGACATNARKTHCIHGHEFTVENTYFDNIGRHCKICIRNKTRRYRLRHRKLKSKDEVYGWGFKSSP